MNIIIVGNILRDVYLNLDSRTEVFETDKHGTEWLNLSFDASEHHFFHRESSLGGAAVSLEVFQNLGIKAKISDYDLDFNHDLLPDISSLVHRYILVANSQVTYFSPTTHPKSLFTPPDTPCDYLYLDRSAEISKDTVTAIQDYLDQSPQTKLILYLQNLNNPHLSALLPLATLIFIEDRHFESVISDAPKLTNLDPTKLIHLSDNQLSYSGITESITTSRIDMMTHLSTYSIAAATILGCFILGYSVEDSLKFARFNLENSRLNATLPLAKLQELASTSSDSSSLELIAKNLVLYPKGILAADESGGSIHKKFAQLNIPDTADNRRDYRNLFFTTPNLHEYVNGVILFDETTHQLADNGQNFVDFLISKQIIPGIKVDQGLENFPASSSPNSARPEESFTRGLDNLASRLPEYHQMGLRFAKWRSAFNVRFDENGNLLTPTHAAIVKNCQDLAAYAKICQENGFVPIVEPELVYDGNYDINLSDELTSQILDCLFEKLANAHVDLKACILKTNMILAGKQFQNQSSAVEVGNKTAEILKNHVPSELAGVVFLSGGQTVTQATDNLAEIVENGPFPWPITFSFARALQDPALYAWQGNDSNTDEAKSAFLERLIANCKVLKSTEK